MRLFRKFLYLLVAIVLVVTLASCGNEDGDGSSYTISFDTNGGIKINDQVVDWDKNPELPTPTRTGYTFAGWFLDSKLTKPLTTNFNFTESITVYAKWTVNKYKVTFMLDEETLYREIEKEYQSVATVEVPEKKNYSFVDWYLDKELTQPFDGYVSANDITVYAKFEANSMMVSFSSPHSASTQKMNGVTLTWGGNTKLPANTFTRPGYEFAGWSLEDGGEVLYVDQAELDDIKASTELKLFAAWTPNQYQVLFLSNDKEYSKYNGNVDSVVICPSINPTLDGYNFLGWYYFQLTADKTFDQNKTYYNVDGSIASVVAGTEVSGSYYEKVSLDANTTIPVNGLVLYAAFEANNYTVKFNANGGVGEIANQNASYNEEFVLSTNSFTREGYTFQGWSLTANGQLTYANEAKVMNLTSETEVELFAVWAANQYTISFFGNGGEVDGSHSINVTYDQPYGELPTANKAGYTFVGWFTSATDGLEVKAEDLVKILSNVDLYAHYATGNSSYVIEFHTEDFEGNYALDESLTQTKSGLTDSTVTLELDKLDAITGFSPVHHDNEKLSGEINASGNLKLIVFLSRNSYDITFRSNLDNEIVYQTQALYQSKVLYPQALAKKGYSYAVYNGLEEVYNSLDQSSTDVVVLANTELNVKYTPNTYTVIFNKGLSGDVVTGEMENQTFTFDKEQQLSKNAFALTGYNFLGWSTSTSGEVLYQDMASVSNLAYEGTITLYAKWSKAKFAISFDTKGGSPIETITEDYETMILEPTLPTKNGYEFDGWFDENDNAVLFPITVPSYDINLYVKWKTVTYHIVYSLNGGSLEEDNVESYNIESASFTLNNPTKEGYSFAGWTGTGLQTAQLEVTVSSGSTGSRNYTANFVANNYTIKFNGNGHTNNGKMLLQRMTYDTEEKLSATKFERIGYTFQGWALSADGEVLYGDQTKVSNLTAKADETVILYAVWKQNVYTIAFNKNNIKATGSMSGQTFTYEEEKALSLNEYSLTGYTFIGWALDSDGEVVYTDGEVVKQLTTSPDGSINLNAIWQANDDTPYVVNHYQQNANDSEYTLVSHLELEGTSDAIVKPEVNQYDGFTSPDEVEVVILPDGSLVVEYRYVRIRYNIKFDSNGGTSVQTINSKYGANVTQPADPTKVGYTFVSWDVEFPETMPLGGLELTALWQINQYTINFKLEDDAEEYYASIEQDYNTSVTSPLDPTKTGYLFAGWSQDVPETMPAQDLLLVATWTPIEYVVKFNGNGNTNNITMNDATYTYDLEAELSTNLYAKTGYTFLGWSTNSDATEAEYADEEEVLNLLDTNNASMTLYAVWTVNHYQVNFNGNGNTNEASMAAMTLAYDEAANLTANTFTKLGYTFLGWSTNSNATEADFADEDSISKLNPNDEAVVNLYAVWSINTYYINYVLNGGSLSEGIDNPTSYDVLTAITLPSPTKTGYTFTGWLDEASELATSVPAGSIGDRSFEATWTLNNPNIEFVGSYIINKTYDGNKVTLTVLASHPLSETYELSYQWYKGSDTIDGANTTSLELLNNAHSGSYYCVVTITDGTQTKDSQTPVAEISIAKKALTITADAKSKTYGEEDPALTYTSSGLVSGDAITGSLTREAGNDADTYDILQGTLSAGNNYEISYTKATFTINKKALTVTAQDKEVTYGDAIPAYTVSYNGFILGEDETVLDGELAFECTYVQYADVNTYTITPKGLTSDNYEISFVAGTLTVSQKEVGLSWSTDPLTYNGQAKAPTATATGLVNGDEIAVTVSGAGINAGDYTATATALTGDKAANYKLPTLVTKEYSIGKTDITLTLSLTGWTYGSTKNSPVLTGNAGNGSVTYQYKLKGADDSTYTTTVPTNAGNYVVKATVLETANYNGGSKTSEFAIAKKALTITADAKSKTYGEEDPALTYTSSGLVSGDAITGSLTREAGNDADTYDILQGTLSAGNNYEISYTKATFTINKKALTVTAQNKEVTYGDAIPAYTVSYNGFILGEDEADLDGTLAFECTYVQYADVNTYTITPKGLTSDNYEISFVAGTLTVSQKEVTINWGSDGDFYNGATQTTTASFQDVHGNNQDLVVGNTSSKDAGEYTLTASGLSANYKATLTHKYTINKVALTVTADAKAKTYGQSDPALTYQITSGALVGSETLSGALAREAGNNAGTYAINQGTLQASNNYTLAFVGANLVINKADINASVAATAADYTGSNITPTLTTTTATTVNNMTASWYFGTDGLNYGEKDVLPQFSAAGVHTIYYKVCADNHNDLTGSFSFTINYVVTFVSAGHGTVDTTVGRTSNDQFAFTRVTTPATGYHFVNFTVSGGSATISGATISNIDDNVTVTANFAANTYTITFNGNKGEGSSDVALDADTKVVTYDALLSGSVLKATRDGYTFTGWYTSDGTKLINVAATAWNFVNQEGYVENNTWKYAGDITLYAGWEALDYVVSFDANKATGSTGAVAQMDDIDVTFNGTYGTLPNPTRNGYAFAGWYLTSACNNEDLVEATSSVLTAANHTLYAKWVKSGYVSYTVEHYQQNIIDDNYTLADTDVIDNQQADTLTKGIAKVYVGFEEANSFSQINIDADGNNNVVKIYYNRQVKTLNFISNDTSVHANVSNDYRYGYQLTSTAFLDQDGYDYTISVTLPLTVEDDLDIDVTYVTRERAIRLYANNGTQAYVDIKEEYDVDVTISNAYDLVRTGYTFDGWNTKADGTGTAYSSGSVIKMPVDGLNLYAKWVLNAPEITTQPVAYEGTYDGVGTTLSVVASHPLSDTYNLTYAWYKDSILIPGETTNSLELVDVNASGDYKCVVSISDGTQNKQTTSSEVKVTILQKALTITANNKTITYGDLPTNAGVTYTGLVAGDTLSGTLSYDYDYVQFGNVGTSDITPSGLSNDNYDITFAPGTLTVSPKEVTLEWNTTTFTYDGTTKVPTLTVSGTVNNEVLGATITGGQKNAGNYTATVSELTGEKALNYQLPAANTHQFTINKVTLSVTADNKSVIYGEEAPTYTVTITGFVNNEDKSVLTEMPIATSAYVAGTTGVSSLDITCSGGSATNYSFEYHKGTLTVEKADPTFTAPSAKSLTYNGQAQELVNAGSSSHGTFEYKLGDGEWSTSLPSATSAQDYAVSWRLVGDNNHNDVENISISNVKINKAALTITADAKAKTYGEADPELTYTASGLVGSDTITGSLSRAAGNNVGTYDILQGTLSAGDNYEITYTKATFTINKKALNITAVAKAKTYGESDPELTYTSSGLVGNDTITGSLTRETGDNVGSYDILQGTLSAGNNYEISYTKASFTINKATLTVTADAKQVTYGADAPAFTNQITGYAEGDDESVITGNVSYTCSYTSTSVSAEYAITVSGNLTADNYDFNYVAGKLTVNAIISYNANGGSGSMTATVGLTPEVVNSTFANSGKHFAGWYTSYLFETKVEVGTKVNVNTELYAKWEANQVTVVLNGNGENSTTGSAKATYGASSLSNLVHATREGYTLVGYYTAFEDGIKVLNANGNFVNSDVAGYITNGKWSNLEDHNGTVTLYAIWEKTGHIIRYYRGAGDLIMTNGYDNGADVTLSFIPSKVGYTFVGWNTEADGTGTPYSSNGTIENLSSDMTLFAQWTANVLTVSYIKGNEDATGTMSETTEISYDMALTGNYSFAECAFELSGNVFNGWVKDNGVALTANGILELLQNGDAETKLQARWIPSPTIKYTVEHYFETASGYEINDEKTQEYLGYDKQFVVAEPIEVDGYYYDSSIQGTVNSGRIVSNGSLVLKLYYSIIGHTITFDTNGGSQISDMYLGEGSSIVVPTPTKVGYTFTGWTYYQLISEEFVETSALTLMPDTDLKLVANWSINTYKVTYYLTIDNVNYEGYESHYDASKNALVFEYEFGATVDAAPVVRNSSNNTPDSWSKTLTTMPAEDVSIYAYWPIVSYHLTMNYLEVVNDEVVDTIYHDLYLAEGSNLDRYFHPEKAGYSFDERRFFKTTDTEIQVKTYYLYDLETASFVEVSTPEYAKLNQYYELFVLENMPSYNIELFVAASPETYNIKYYDKTTDSEVVSDKEYFVLVNNSFELVENPDAENLGNYYQLTTVSNINYNDSIALASPEREGYKFGGWNEIGKGNYYLGGQTIIVNNNIVLVAEWSQQEYTIIFTDGFGNEIGQINGASSQGFMDYIAYLDTQISDLANICALPAYAIALYLMGDTTGVANLMFMGYEKYCPGMYDYVKKNGSEALTTLINYINTQNANLLGDADFISTIPGKMIQAIMYASSSDQTIMMTGINTLLSIDTTAYGYVLYADLINAVKAAVMSGNTTNIGAACAALYTDIATNINYFAGTLADHLSDAIQQGGLIDVLPDSVYYLYISDIQLTDGSTVIKYIDLFRRYNSYAGGANGDLINDFASDSMAVKYRLFTEYSDNAYYPTRNGCIFDHWTMSKSGNTITYTAQWRYQLEEPTNVRVENIKKQSVEFTWDEVSEANGYRVTYTIKGGTKQVVDVVSNNITIEIENGQSINLSVIALGNPEYLLLQNEYNGNTVTAIESFKLNSESSVEVEYVHNANTEDFDVSASGQYYYYDASTESYLLFASQSYNFGSKEIEKISDPNGVANIQENNGTYFILTGTKTGTFEFKVSDGKTVNYYKATVQPLVQSIVSTGSFRTYEKNYDNSSLGMDNATFIHQSENGYQVGVSNDNYDNGFSRTINGNSYKNGFYLDIIATTTSGINKAIDYEVVVMDSAENIVDCYYYDYEQNVIYFAEEAAGNTYTITVRPKQDSDDYINTQIPKARKNSNLLNYSFDVVVNNGVNVYTDEQLKKYYEDLSISEINIHSDIVAKLSPTMLGYYQYLIDNNTGLLGTGGGHYIGDVDTVHDFCELNVKNGTAVMIRVPKDASGNKIKDYGPAIWTTNGTGSPVFTDRNGTGWYYDRTNGDYAILSCDWEVVERKSAEDAHGTFKILNLASDYYEEAEAASLKLAFVYQRAMGKADSDEANNVTINGNYFNIDASKLPFLNSSGLVSVGGLIAAYDIQNVQVSIFGAFYLDAEKVTYDEDGKWSTSIPENSLNVTFNDLSIEGNTMNISEWLSDNNSTSVSSIAEYMKKTSSGYCGIKAEEKWMQNNLPTYPLVNLVTNNVAIKNTTIGLYTLRGSNLIANYTHVSQSWANGLDGNSSNNHELNYCKIETSGGGATHLEDFYITPENHENMNVKIDYHFTTITNWIAGDEQWFKAYGTAVMALGMKSALEAGMHQVKIPNLCPNGLTIIETFKDSLTGQDVEKMNLIAMGKLAVKDVNNYVSTDIIGDKGGYGAGDAQVEFTWYDEYDQPYQLLYDASSLGLGKIYRNTTYTKFILVVLKDVGSDKMYIVIEASPIK